jgi:hypothetical protein
MIIGRRYRALLLDGGGVALFEGGATDRPVVIVGIEARQLWRDLEGLARGVPVDAFIKPYLRVAPTRRGGGD